MPGTRLIDAAKACFIEEFACATGLFLQRELRAIPRQHRVGFDEFPLRQT